ncbi:MAG: hypothetical protein HKN16_12935, partial [Saprospiraceae bacterium]|nr:hypothetical protein [Saprospiraceae bacterium]
ADHPGDSRPTISVEGCSDSGTYNTGFATEWPEDDYDSNRSVSHEENIDINTQTDQFLRGYPKGFDEEHLINSTTDLSFQINFRNSGPDTAIRVVIRDTISSLLDPSTIIPGASSHNYEYEVYGDGILKFTFENINLTPDGGADSEGFVKYRVSQKPDNPFGSLIKNSATIYLGFDYPQYTGQTCHKISDSLLVRVIPEPLPGLTGIEAFPNPFNEQTTIKIMGSLPIQEGLLRVYDGVGRLISVKEFFGKEIIIGRDEVASGALFFQLESGGRLLGTGQLIAQ